MQVCYIKQFVQAKLGMPLGARCGTHQAASTEASRKLHQMRCSAVIEFKKASSSTRPDKRPLTLLQGPRELN